ncbi:MAG: 1-acyl-sn-glycerol-3-phosphate acyltransferase [Ruminococcaceae bacterium]|nr:1-acyl-sn-glycerol-3-phosphate acyltransferase [Oscillospiraceae bacterium]
MMNNPPKAAAAKFEQAEARLPARLLYSIAVGIICPVIKWQYNVKIKRIDMDKVNAPFILLSNHCSRLDWIYTAMAVKPCQLNAVITRYFYSNPKLKVWLDRVGAIAKDQFTPDVPAVKKIMKTVRMGGNIMLFPEGRTSPAGLSETFEYSTIKLLRHMKVPVVAVKMEGSYLSMPKWNASKRRGRVDLTVTPLFLPEEYDTLSDDEMFRRMCRVLATDEFAWESREKVAFRCRHFAKGLDGVLYQCPRCGKELVTLSDDHSIWCSSCGNGARLNNYYGFEPFGEDCVIPENIAQWFQWQVEQVREHIASDPDLELRSKLTMLHSDGKKWLTEVGSGEARLNREGFFYSGTRNGEPCEIHVPLASLPAIPYNPNESIDIYSEGEAFTFKPENGQESQRWSIYAEQLHEHYIASGRASKARGLEF